jgi:hypothetical protein
MTVKTTEFSIMALPLFHMQSHKFWVNCQVPRQTYPALPRWNAKPKLKGPRKGADGEVDFHLAYSRGRKKRTRLVRRHLNLESLLKSNISMLQNLQSSSRHVIKESMTSMLFMNAHLHRSVGETRTNMALKFCYQRSSIAKFYIVWNWMLSVSAAKMLAIPHCVMPRYRLGRIWWAIAMLFSVCTRTVSPGKET